MAMLYATHVNSEEPVFWQNSAPLAMDVASHIMPVTVHTKSLNRPDDFSVLEQNRKSCSSMG